MFKSLSEPNISDPKYAINAKIDSGISTTFYKALSMCCLKRISSSSLLSINNFFK